MHDPCLFAHFFGCLEIVILILRALDCYVTIYKALHYTAIMSHQVCGMLMVLAWVGSYVDSSAQIFLNMSLSFCGHNVIDHYFFYLQPLLKLACAKFHVTKLLLMSNSGAIFPHCNTH